MPHAGYHLVGNGALEGDSSVRQFDPKIAIVPQRYALRVVQSKGNARRVGTWL